MGEFIFFVFTETQVVFFDAEVQIPVETLFFPVLKPFVVGSRLAEKFQFGLLKFARSENERLGCYFVAEAFADLGNAEGYFDSGGVENVSEVGEDTLCGFGGR